MRVGDADQRVRREGLVDAFDELHRGFGIGAEQLLELTQELVELVCELVVAVLVVVIVVMVVVVVVVVSHPAKLADLARGGGQFPTVPGRALVSFLPRNLSGRRELIR